MSDVNKIIAAILTAGRVPTMSQNTSRPMEDWLAEYEAWLDVLARQDKRAEEAQAQAFSDAHRTSD